MSSPVSSPSPARTLLSAALTSLSSISSLTVGAKRRKVDSAAEDALSTSGVEAERTEDNTHDDDMKYDPRDDSVDRDDSDVARVDSRMEVDGGESESKESVGPSAEPTVQASSPDSTSSVVIISSSPVDSLSRLPRKAKQEATHRVQAMAVSLRDETEVGGRRRSHNNNAHTPHDESAPPARRRARGRGRGRSSRASSASQARSKKRPLEASDIDSDEVQIIDDAPPASDEEDLEEPADTIEIDDDEEEEEEEETTENASTRGPARKRVGMSRAAVKSATRQPAAAASSTAATPASRARPSSSPSTLSIPASSTSSSSHSSSKKSRDRDLRRDKRISGFGPWKVVHKTSIPAMTYEGYEDLATETLEKETQIAVQNSQIYTPQGTDSYHRDPTDILTGKAEMPLTLMRRVDTKYGREEYKVKASRTIEKKEVVAFLGGRLMEMVKANKQNREEWNQHFHMKREWLKEFFEYQGQHDLVVSTKDHKCIASYIRSPEERDDEGEGANLKADVVFDPKVGLFMVIYYALEKISKGKEVFCMPFLGEWHDRCHREMFLYSRVSHWLHKWASILEKNLLAAGVEFDTSVPPHMHSIILTADQEEKFLNIPGMDQGALPEPLPVEKSMVIVDVQEAMGYCNCEYSAKARQIDLSVETKHYLEAVGDFIPDYLQLKGPIDGEFDDDGEPVMGVHKCYVDRDQVLEVMENGYRKDCLELREELGIHSPVRHFTPPNYRAFCVVATAPIPAGTFVFAYAGEISEEVVNRDSAYVYMMEREQIRRTVRTYHGPDLCLDALKVGNISRFVNDSMYRLGEADEKGSTANLETQFLFRAGEIHLGFYTTRDVDKGEELVSQYGEDYWKTINKQLVGEHKKFYEYINPYTRKLESLTYKIQRHLPAPPPDDWQTEEEEIFQPKPLPYPTFASSTTDADDGSHEVERILQMRTDWEGRIEYLVKWKHSTSAENSWIKEKQIIDCVDLIAEFKDAEANKRGGAAAAAARGKNTAKKSTKKASQVSKKKK